MERKDFHLGSELSFQDEHPKHNNSFVVPVVCIFSRELYFSVRNFFFFGSDPFTFFNGLSLSIKT